MTPEPAAALDERVVAALAERDPEAVAAAYEALADPLFRYLRSRCDDDDLAADVVEATFVELLRGAPRLEGGETGLRRWMFTAARHNLLDEQRKQRRRGDVALVDEAGGHEVSGHATDTEPSPEDGVLAAERDTEVRRALATLPADQQEVLELRFAGELSASEAGAVMGRSPGAVRVLQHRALKALSAALGGTDPSAPSESVPPTDIDPAAEPASPRGPPRPA